MDYARALAEHPKWRWEPGMMDTNGSAVLIVRDGDPLMAWYTPDRISDVGDEWATGAPPDINHPATKGWLLHMLREATEDASAWAVSDGEMWSAEADYLEMDGPWDFPAAATEGEALAAALLAVWGAA